MRLHDLHAQRLRGAVDAHGDLAPVRDEQDRAGRIRRLGHSTTAITAPAITGASFSSLKALLPPAASAFTS